MGAAVVRGGTVAAAVELGVGTTVVVDAPMKAVEGAVALLVVPGWLDGGRLALLIAEVVLGPGITVDVVAVN